MITLKEHQRISPLQLEGCIDVQTLRRRINYDTSRFVASKVNLLTYDFNCHQLADEFSAYFRIGAEWLDAQQTQPLVVTPKIGNIDFISMFMACLRSNESADEFSKIYDIDFDAAPIKSHALSTILSPLLVVQYLLAIQRLTQRGLRKGYVTHSENLHRVKGRLDIWRNECTNIMQGHPERMYCHYEEYSVDTTENRVLKRALRICADMISLMKDHASFAILSAECNQCLAAFADVTDDAHASIPIIRQSTLYREYSTAMRYAKMLLRKQNMTIAATHAHHEDRVPVFRIDMALLFEHYALAVMRNKFGAENVKYQVSGYKRRFIADFLVRTPRFRAIVDTKYVESRTAAQKAEYIKQLGGYCRDTTLLAALGCDPGDIPMCVILYPTYGSETIVEPLPATVNFYTHSLPIPCY